MKVTQVLFGPVLTEKATQLAQKQIYTFEVDAKADKEEIKHILESIYKIKVDRIRTVTRSGKTRRVGRRMQTKKLKNAKIAYVTVKEGKIDLFPQS